MAQIDHRRVPIDVLDPSAHFRVVVHYLWARFRWTNSHAKCVTMTHFRIAIKLSKRAWVLLSKVPGNLN